MSLNITNCESQIEQNVSISSSKKTPKLIYCGDGVLEEYSSDEEQRDDQKEEIEYDQVNVKSLTWLPWFKYQVVQGASKSLSACDYMGEKLAWWLGITKPKYLYEIEEFKRIQQREQEERSSDTEEVELHYGNNLKEIRIVDKTATSKTTTAAATTTTTNRNLFQSEN